MKITIKNRRTYKGPGEWICRGRSPLGNPFAMATESDREIVIGKYKKWLFDAFKSGNQPVIREMRRLYDLSKSQEEITLICWCAPKACHGDVISETLKLWESMEHNDANPAVGQVSGNQKQR